MAAPARVVLAAPGRPRVSVLIPAWRRAGLLRRCLASLGRHRSEAAFETVILLNGATADVVSLVDDEVEGATVVRSRVNLGFGRGCNRAAAAAAGEYLVLLNDDTEVDDGWLDALVRTADAHPRAGAVGSRISSYDGLLLEAGGLVWREGVSSHVGRGLPESTPRHRFLRRADYCSASSLLVRRSTWDAVGGFDEQYFPGYYEDVDLCLAIGRLGQEILFEPRSCIRHHESGSLEWDSPYKHFVASRSQARFIAKWSDELQRFPALPHEYADPWTRDIIDERALLASRHLHRRALVVDADPSGGPPRPGLAAIVGGLARGRTAVSVHLGGARAPDGRLAGLGVEVVAVDLVAHLAAPTTLYDAVVFRRAEDYRRYASAVRTHQPQAAVVYDAQDVASDVLRLHDDGASPAGSPITGADRIVSADGFDRAVLAMVPGGAPVTIAGGPDAGAGDGSRRPPMADAVDLARRDVLRRRWPGRSSGGPPR
jgi:GT2 family glycosyltransferase